MARSGAVVRAEVAVTGVDGLSGAARMLEWVPMIATWCFQCGLDYADDVAECVECGVPTVPHPPGTLEAVAADGGAQLAYELHAWNGPARAAVARDLWSARIVHAWQGPTLLVREADEEAVDDIIETVDGAMVTSAAEGAATEGGRIGFDLGARNTALHDAVVEGLSDAGVAHELLGNGFLLVDPADEDLVGDIIEASQAGVADADADGFGGGVDGVAGTEVVEALFLAADVLRRNPRDARARRQLLDAAALAPRLSLPFGYEASLWRHVVASAAALASRIDGGDDEIERDAADLRSTLHPYV